jgi:hypothetical protein
VDTGCVCTLSETTRAINLRRGTEVLVLPPIMSVKPGSIYTFVLFRMCAQLLCRHILVDQQPIITRAIAPRAGTHTCTYVCNVCFVCFVFVCPKLYFQMFNSTVIVENMFVSISCTHNHLLHYIFIAFLNHQTNNMCENG